jgi:hypothetical protein
MHSMFFLGLLLLFQSPAQTVTTPTPPPTAQTKQSESAPVDKAKALSRVRRIYVENFGSAEAAQQLQAMLIASLTDCKRLTVTEDKTKADAILKGFATEKTSQEVHAYGSGTSVATASGGHSGSISGSGGNISGSSQGAFGAAASAINDSSVNTETIDSSKASVRLVNEDGDVIWTSTQESKGAKYKGASADVADKIVKQLLRDIERAEKPTVATTGTN